MRPLTPAPLLVLIAVVGACSGGNTGGQPAKPQVVTKVACPAETKLDNGKCVANTACAAGLHFEAGQGCVADVVAATPAPESPPPTSAPAASGSAAASPAPAASGSCPAGMASLPGGTFTMTERQDNISVSASAFSVSAFCIDQAEVTIDQYSACVGGRKCDAKHLGEQSNDGVMLGGKPRSFTKAQECNYGVSGRGIHPINCVDWNQARAYCAAQGKWLPTDEQWEYAARGGSNGWQYPWGNAEPGSQVCWSGLSKRTGTCAVGSFVEGDAPGGIHDMAGNVSEWTSGGYYAGARAARGGSWGDDNPHALRGALHDGAASEDRSIQRGFRCAKAQ